MRKPVEIALKSVKLACKMHKLPAVGGGGGGGGWGGNGGRNGGRTRVTMAHSAVS